MKNTQGEHIAFISGGNLSKSSYNKLNRYRNKLAKNYDNEKKKEIREFVKNLSKGKYDAEKFEYLLDRLHLIKNPVDKFDYNNFNLQPFQKINMLQQFIQKNMMSMRLLKQLQKGKSLCYKEINKDN